MHQEKNPPVLNDIVRVLFPNKDNDLKMVDFLSSNGYVFEKGKYHFVYVADSLGSAKNAMFLFKHGVIA